MRLALVASVVFLFGFIVFSAAAWAGPLGAPGHNIWRRPIAFSVAAGVGFGQRDVHIEEKDKVQDEMSSSSFLTKVTLSPANYIEVYGLLGASDLQLDDAGYKGALSFAYGGGIRPALLPSFWNVKTNLHIALDGQYMTFRTEDDGVDAVFQEAQAALIVAYALAQGIAPYGGIKYDYASVNFDGSDSDLLSDLDWALFVGCDYSVTDEVFFNVELNIFSETRIFAGVGYRY